MSSTDSNEKRTMYSESDSSIIMICYGADEIIIQELFDSRLNKRQIGLD